MPIGGLVFADVDALNTPSILTDTTGIPKNANRRAWNIQNLDTDVLFVLLGVGASSTVFHFALKGGTGNDDGLGGLVGQSEGLVYRGVISVAGTTPRYTVMEVS